MRRPVIRKHLSNQMIETIVDEYEHADLLEDRAEYSIRDLMSCECVNESIARKLQHAIHKRMGNPIERNF